MSRAPGTRRRCGEAASPSQCPAISQTVTGGYAYDRRIIAELQAPRLGGRSSSAWATAFRGPPTDRRRLPKHACSRPRRDRPIVIDGLAFGVLPEAAAALHRTHPVIALVHHPLALETGLTDARRRRCLRANARRSRRHGTSSPPAPATADVLTERLRRRARAPRRSSCPARIARRSRRAATMPLCAALGRRDRPAQGLRPAGRGTGAARRPVLASDHRGRPRARSGRDGAPRCADRPAPASRADRRCRHGLAGRSSRRFTPAPICSCWPRASRATAWPSPKRSRTACR